MTLLCVWEYRRKFVADMMSYRLGTDVKTSKAFIAESLQEPYLQGLLKE